MNFGDSYWFSELPVGKRDRSDYFELINEYGYVWGRTEYKDDFS